MRTALRVGWRAGVGRGGAAVGADRRGQGGGAWRGGLAPPGGQPGLASGPGARGASLSDAPEAPCASSGMSSSRLAGRSGPAPGRLISPSWRPRAGKGGAGEGAPTEADPDASLSDASASFPGSAEERRFGSDGPRAWGAADRRPAPSRASGRAAALEPALRAAFSDASAASDAPLSSAFRSRPRRPQGRICRRFPSPVGPLRIMSDKASLSDIATPTTSGADYVAHKRDKAPPKIHHAPRDSRRPRPARRPCRRPRRARVPAPPPTAPARAKRTAAKTPEQATPFRRRPPVPAWARASGRAGQGDPLFFAGAGLALLDAHLRRDPPAAGRAARPPRPA